MTLYKQPDERTCSMSTYQQLWHIILTIIVVGLEHLPELGVRVDNIWNTLGRVKSGDLYDILTQRPFELVHLLFGAQGAEFTHVEI